MASPSSPAGSSAVSASSSSGGAWAIRRSKRDALAGGQRGAILARRLADRRAARQQQPSEDNADHSFEANFDNANVTPNANASPSSNTSPVKPVNAAESSESIDRTADLTSSLNQSDLGALNISPVKKKASPASKIKTGSGGGYSLREYNFDSSPDASPDRTDDHRQGQAAPLPSRSPARSPNQSPSGTTTRAQPMTPGTAAATYARTSQERKRNKSSPGGSPHIIQQVGSDLTDDDAYNSPYRHGYKTRAGSNYANNASNGSDDSRDELHGRQGNAFHQTRLHEVWQQQQQGPNLGIGQHPGVKLVVSKSSKSGTVNATADTGLNTGAAGGKPLTTPGRRSSTKSSGTNRGSPRTPSRVSPTRTPTATPPRIPPSQAPRSSPPPRQLHSPPKRGAISPHETHAAVRAAAHAINGSFPGAPQTAMDNSFDRNIYGPWDTSADISSSFCSSSSSAGPWDTSADISSDCTGANVSSSFSSAGVGDDGSSGNSSEGDALDASFESIVKEFTLDSSYVMEDAEYGLEEGEAPDDEVLIDDGLDDLEAFAAEAKARARAKAQAKAQARAAVRNSPAGSTASRSVRSGDSSKVEQYIAAVQKEVREADSRGEWVSFDEDASDAGSSAFGSPHSRMDDDGMGGGGVARVWPPPQTPTRSPPSSAGPSPTPNERSEASPDRSKGAVSAEGDDNTIPSVSTATDGTERTNNMTPSRPNNMLAVSTPRRSPPRGIITPSRIGVNYGVSPGRIAAGVRLMDDDNTTIRTDDESYKFMTPQRAAQNGVRVVPGTPVKPSTPLGLNSPSAATPDTERDISFESNELNVTIETIQANNTTTSMIANEAAMNIDTRSVESDALQTVDDRSLGTRVSTSADSDVNSVVQEYNTKTGSKVIPGRSGYDNKEACSIFREFEEFVQSGLYELADEVSDSVRNFSKRVGFFCVGKDEMKHLRNGDTDDRSRGSSSSCSSSRKDRRSRRLNRIMSTQRLRRLSSNRSQATTDSETSRPVVRVPSRTGHQVKESFAC